MSDANSGLQLRSLIKKSGDLNSARVVLDPAYVVNPQTGKPETAIFKAIKGADSFYSVQRAVRALPNAEQTVRLTQYLAEVSVCDTRTPAHPCPASSR